MAINHRLAKKIETVASQIIAAAGKTGTLVTVCLLTFLWAVSGFYLHFSEQWEMIISTASSVVTFIMVFLIQKSQNKDSLSIQLKLNELVAANHLASNRLVDVEGMSEDELKVIQKYYAKLSHFAATEQNPQTPHSIDESHHAHDIKNEMEQELGDVKKRTE